MRHRTSQKIGHYHRTSFTTPSRDRLRRRLFTVTPIDSCAVSFKYRARIRWRGVCALWGFCYFPCRRGGGMINFWGDFTFFLFSLYPSPGCPLAKRPPFGGLFLFWVIPLENGLLAWKTIVHARFFPLTEQEAAPALPAQRGRHGQRSLHGPG